MFDNIMSTERIGFIGLGIMGKQMASNLMRRGYQLTVFNRSKKSVNELQLQGAFAANSPRDVASKSDIVIDMVTDAPDVEQVLLGENGVISSSEEGLAVIDMSTNSPEIARSISSRLEENGIEFLDAPVTGGDKGAREATLTIMVGGKREVFESMPAGSRGDGQGDRLHGKFRIWASHEALQPDGRCDSHACDMRISLAWFLRGARLERCPQGADFRRRKLVESLQSGAEGCPERL